MLHFTCVLVIKYISLKIVDAKFWMNQKYII